MWAAENLNVVSSTPSGRVAHPNAIAAAAKCGEQLLLPLCRVAICDGSGSRIVASNLSFHFLRLLFAIAAAIKCGVLSKKSLCPLLLPHTLLSLFFPIAVTSMRGCIILSWTHQNKKKLGAGARCCMQCSGKRGGEEEEEGNVSVTR